MLNLLESEIELQSVVSEMTVQRGIQLSIARLDKIHPIVSGNKLYKLTYFLKEAIASSHKKILTFGGAYSNHLVATAYAAQQAGIRSIGIVRGEKPLQVSHTLQYCSAYGMELSYITREDYKNPASASIKTIIGEQGNCTIIPEGGYHPLGAKGAGMIMQKINKHSPSHICLPVGTATTLAGVLFHAETGQQVIGFNALKNMTDIEQRINYLINKIPSMLVIESDYDFGGYAKFNNILIDFMNTFYCAYKIELDFLYTAKMMYGVMEKIAFGHFKEGSHIICLHTGGLQGNKSLHKLLLY